MGVIPFLNISAISQHDFNSGLELASPGVIEKSRLYVGLRKVAAAIRASIGYQVLWCRRGYYPTIIRCLTRRS